MLSFERHLTWAFFLCDLLLVFALFYFGGVQFLLGHDQTLISLFLIGSYVISNVLFFGVVFSYDPEKIFYFKNCITFLINTFLTIGLIGTIVGFMSLFYELFGNLDFSNPDNVKEIISQMTNGMGIALLTTLSGLIVSTLTYFKLTVLGYE